MTIIIQLNDIFLCCFGLDLQMILFFSSLITLLTHTINDISKTSIENIFIFWCDIHRNSSFSALLPTLGGAYYTRVCVKQDFMVSVFYYILPLVIYIHLYIVNSD